LASRRISSTAPRSISPARWGARSRHADRLTDTLTAQLGAADVRRTRDAAVAQAVRRGPDLATESHAVQRPADVRVGDLGERLPRLDLERTTAEWTSDADAITTRQVGHPGDGCDPGWFAAASAAGGGAGIDVVPAI